MELWIGHPSTINISCIPSSNHFLMLLEAGKEHPKMKSSVRDLGYLFSSSKASLSLQPYFKYMEIKLKLLIMTFLF